MPDNSFKQLESLKHFTKLTSLDLSGSQFLTAIPDLSASPNIKSLDACECRSLVEVHPSVGYLDKLQNLDFRNCGELTKFPNKVRWKSLKTLNLNQCRKLESFPEIVDKMESLYKLSLNETAIKELPASIGHLTALEILCLRRTAIEGLPSSIGDFTALHTLELEGCENLANLPQSIYGLQKLVYFILDRCPKLVTLPNNLISQVLSSAALRSVFSVQESNLSDINSLENFCCWSNLMNLDLSKSNFVSLPVCISKFVNLEALNLSGCKKLVEIVVQLPASIRRIKMADCISLERFSTLSKILEDGDMQHIAKMNLFNCQRLCDNIGLDAAKMANILVNNQSLNDIDVVLPGSEVPELFSFRQDDLGVLLPRIDLQNQHWFDFPFEIPRTSGLVSCIVWELTESFTRPCFPILASIIDGVRFTEWPSTAWPIQLNWCWSGSEGETGAGHVWLHYIPSPALMKPKGDDGKSDDQLKPSIGRNITVSYGGPEGLLFKSFGAHLSRISMPKDGDDGKNDEDEDELDDDDDDVGDVVRPRKR